MTNKDAKTVEGFGDEWTRFDQSDLSAAELTKLFQTYFARFPWGMLQSGAVGFDLGCGSGRWARCVAPLVGRLHCIDASADALAVARRNLAGQANCEFHLACADQMPIADGSMDFGYSLGVLHHTPDTAGGVRACLQKLKRGAPFLLYLYYAFDNRPLWFRWVWRASELTRAVVSRSPFPLRYGLSQAFALGVYLPLARSAKLVERLGMNPSLVPLSFYRESSFYTMRTDALDRFGTRLEQRFSCKLITEMMTAAGFERVTFNEHAPFWCALAYRA